MAGNNASSLSDIHSAAKNDSRPIHRFTIPESLARESGITQVGLVELLADDELNATRRAHNDPIRLAYELARESLREIDGKPVSLANGSLDLAWNRMAAKVRTLVMTAYSSIHQPGDELTSGFLKSRTTTVG